MSSDDKAQLTLAGDQLGRQHFVERLTKYIVAVADSDVLPAGRVIAINAPWGAGKSWVAERLVGHLASEQQIGREAIYVNAFQFDFHQDPFAVLASAILSKAKGSASNKAGLREAAKKVLTGVLPAAAKGVAKATAKRLIGDDGIEEVTDALADSTEKAVDAMLDTFTEAQQSSEAFRSKLQALAQSGGGPLVIIIDELDRCRPTFALELLERIKHLFDVPNVVFLLFFHRAALASAICQMYGSDINTDAYLRKFVSVNLDLPSASIDNSGSSRDEKAAFIHDFLRTAFPAPKSQEQQDFRHGLAELAPLFNATLRDVQTVMLMSSLLGRKLEAEGQLGAYVLLLKLFVPLVLDGMRKREPTEFKAEVTRFGSSGPFADRPIWFRRLYAALRMESDPMNRVSMDPQERRECDEIVGFIVRSARSADLEHVRLSP